MTVRSLFNSLLLGSLLAPLAALAADTPATIGAAVQGTYSMTFYKGSSASTTSPVAAGKVSTIIVGTGNQLCVDGVLLSNPVYRNNNTFEAIWGDGKYEYALSPLTTTTGNEVNLSDAAGSKTWHGQYRGNLTSTSTSMTGCAAAATTPTVTTTMQSVFDLAAELYPTMFVNGSALGNYQGYVYKFFAASGIYVGVKDDHVYLFGGQWPSISDQGTVAVVQSYLQTTKTNLAQAVSGLYKLTLSGNLQATVSGFSTSIPVNVTINNIAAPAPTDTALITSQVQSSLGATGIGNVKVVVVNNTASRVTFTVTFTAVLASYGNVTYNLTYDYTK